MRDLCAGDVRGGEGEAFFNLAAERVFEAVWMSLEQRAMRRGRAPDAQDAKRNFGGGKVGLRLLNDAADRLERLALRVDDGAGCADRCAGSLKSEGLEA